MVRKMAGVGRDVNRMKFDIQGITEVRWPGVEETKIAETYFVNPGGEELEL